MNEHDADKVTRRRFLDVFLGGSIFAALTAIIYPVFQYLTPPEQEVAVVSSVNLGNADNFTPGDWQIFRFGNKPGILIRDLEGRFRAFFATCTHLDCIVQYDEKEESILCACHNGRYDLNGINISGPPPRPLSPMSVNIHPESNDLVITADDERRT